MEILLYIIVGLIGLALLFLIIEHPYYFIAIYFFIVFYRFNIDLPGPLDFRGILTIVLLFRLIIFDKDNLKTIMNNIFRNRFFIMVIIFELLFLAVTYGTSNSYKSSIKEMIFRIIGLLLGALAVYRGYTKQVFFTVLVCVGLLATLDLIYSYSSRTQVSLRVTRVIDVFFKSEYKTDLNHNEFGMFNSLALLVTSIMVISSQINKKIGVGLLLIFSTGLLLSTSRGALASVIISLFISIFLLPKDKIDKSKITKIVFSGILLFLITISSYLIVLSTLNISSEFSDKIYYRLVEEPMMLLEGKESTFRGDSQNLKEGSASWRITKAISDFKNFAELSTSQQLIGYGYAGYYNIGEREFDRWGMAYQMSSHNGLATLIIERGIIGFVLFYIIAISLFNISLRNFKDDISEFPFFLIFLYSLIFIFIGNPMLLDRFGYIVMGGAIGQYLRIQHSIIENYDNSQ
jgi:O-Antigen ligase